MQLHYPYPMQSSKYGISNGNETEKLLIGFTFQQMAKDRQLNAYQKKLIADDFLFDFSTAFDHNTKHIPCHGIVSLF